MKKLQFKGGKLVPVQIGGVAMKINPNSIDKDKRTLHHGEHKGTKVNSPESCIVGDSYVLWPEAGKPTVISMSRAGAVLAAKHLLESEGATVTFAA
jgi:hypothetical protein